MNPSERLNDRILYLNCKNLCNLKDLVEKYAISKSTALRDVQSLEKIGMPIYWKLGGNGCCWNYLTFKQPLVNGMLRAIILKQNE